MSHLPRKWFNTMRLLQRIRLQCMQKHGLSDLPYLRRLRRYQCLTSTLSLFWFFTPSWPATSQPQTPAEYHPREPGSPGESLYASITPSRIGNFSHQRTQCHFLCSKPDAIPSSACTLAKDHRSVSQSAALPCSRTILLQSHRYEPYHVISCNGGARMP